MATAASRPKDSKEAIVLAKNNIYAVLNNEKTKQAIKAALPDMGVTPERVATIAFSVIASKPQLLECDARSLVKVIVEGSLLGLSFDPHLKQAAIVPFKAGGVPQATLIVEYMGLVKLARNGGVLSHIVCAEIVYEKDLFQYQLGEEPRLEHRPLLNGSRGKALGCYVVAKLTDGGTVFKYLSQDEIYFYREKSRAKDAADSPWNTDEFSMWRKTVIRRLMGYLPMDDKTQRAMHDDEMAETGHDQLLAPEVFGDDVIDLPPAEPKKSKTEEAKERLQQQKRTAEESQAATASESDVKPEMPGAETAQTGEKPKDELRDQMFTHVMKGLDIMFPKIAQADIAVSEATAGKYQSRDSLLNAPMDVLQQVLDHMKGMTAEDLK
jgi:recombination protein RecT